jgi:hypothetical protein
MESVGENHLIHIIALWGQACLAIIVHQIGEWIQRIMHTVIL